MIKHLVLNSFLLLVVSAVSAADVAIERSGELRFAFGGGFRAAALVNYNNWGASAAPRLALRGETEYDLGTRERPFGQALVELERRIDDSGVLQPIVAAETPEAAELLRRPSREERRPARPAHAHAQAPCRPRNVQAHRAHAAHVRHDRRRTSRCAKIHLHAQKCRITFPGCPVAVP